MLPDRDVRLRAATTEDARFIVEMARYACVIEDWPLPGADSEETQSLLPKSGDTVIVATAAGEAVGAAWTFSHRPALAVGLPEVTIGVVPEMRGKGVGGALLDELIVRAAGEHEALTLNVHRRNPAARFYERKGFRVIGQGRGDLGVAMRRDLP